MDVTAKIKESLIEKINNSSNLQLLKAIKSIFEASEAKPYQLSQEQQQSIQYSREEIDSGYGIPQDEVMKDLKSWLEKQ